MKGMLSINFQLTSLNICSLSLTVPRCVTPLDAFVNRFTLYFCCCQVWFAILELTTGNGNVTIDLFELT